MDNTSRDNDLSGDYEEIPAIRDATSDLTGHTNPQTVRDFQQKLQDLNRENFDLKLRIYFLENNDNNNNSNERLPSSSKHLHPLSQNIYSDQHDYYTIQPSDYNNSRLRSPLSPTRRSSDLANTNENDQSRRSIRHSDESDDNSTTLNTRTRTKTPSANSDLFTVMPVSTHNLQFDERQRQLQEENLSLRQEISSVTTRLNDTSNELRHVQEQYQNELRKNDDQQAKAERVIKRLKADYDERIANLENEQRQKLAQYESYRHEQDHSNSNVNIDEYLRKIEQQERIINDLNERLKQPNPYTVLLPSQSIDDNTRQLEDRLKSYVETIDQLRAECDELQRSEKYLRRQIDDLNRLIEPSNGLSLSNIRSSIVDDNQLTDDPQSAIIQISLQLRNDAENVSGLTNRIAQMIREREDNQNKLKDKDSQIRQYEMREIEFENRTIQKYDLQIEGLQHDIEHLQKQIDNRDRRVKELVEENDHLRIQSREDLEKHFQQEKENLQEQLHIANQHINELRQELDKQQQQQYNDLHKAYEQLKANIDGLQRTIQEQEKQIDSFQQQRIQLERERDFEKGKIEESQNELNTFKRRYNDLENQYEQLTPLLDEQQTKYDKQIRELQYELAQVEQEKDDLNEELEFLKQEKLTLAEHDPKLIELSQSNDELKEQLARYLVRFQDIEDENKRYQTSMQQYDELKVLYGKVQNDLATIENENHKLKHQFEEFEPQIRRQLKHEYENDLRTRLDDLAKYKDTEIENLRREKENLEQLTNDKHRLEKQLKDLQDQIEKYEKDLDQLPQQYTSRIQDLEQQLQTKTVQFNEQIQSYENDKVQTSSKNEELIQQLENQIREQNDLINNLRKIQDNREEESTEIQLRLQIQIQGLEQELDTKDRDLQKYTETVQVQEEQIEKLLEDIQQSDNSQRVTVERLREDIDEKNLAIARYERQLNEVNEQLEDAVQRLDSQLLEIGDIKQLNTRLTLNEQNYLKQIDDLQKQFEMEKKSNESTSADQRDQYQNVIDDLKRRIKQRDEDYERSKLSNENLQRTFIASEQQLTVARQNQHPMSSDQLTSDVENHDRIIASLQQKLMEKDQEINKLNELYSKKNPLDIDDNQTSTIALLRREIQQKDREINDLKQQLDEARKSNQNEPSILPRIRPRQNFDNLNREELLFELDMALQHNQDLNDQLKKKFPTITELHNQQVEVRHELSRQKYVNQVLWRKLNALVDIHGSTTRHELAMELANYQEELAKLKTQPSRSLNEPRSIIFNPNSRSSSEQNLSLFSTNIKSTVALLERTNIDWQTKLARLTEQLGQCESQSRIYKRELIKSQKLLIDAGLISNLSVRQRRRSADDSIFIHLNSINANDNLDKIHNYQELKDIIRNERKYNQQLQMKIRLNTTIDPIQSSAIDKFNEQIHNLNSVIETYKNESNLFKIEFKKLYKSLANSQKTVQQYEQRVQEQTLTNEQLKNKLTKYEQFFKKSNIHPSLFDNKQDHLLDEYLSDLKLKASFEKKDSGFSSATDTIEYQRQIKDKDDEIKQLNRQLNERNEQIQQLLHDLDDSKKFVDNHQDLVDELERARLQIESMKPQYEQNQRLQAEIKQLQNEINTNKPLLDRYRTQSNIFEQKPPLDTNDTSEILIRRNDLAQLLEQIRLLRSDLERSLQKQHDLQDKLDENIRQTQSPREFTFTGRGVSYPDLRLIENSNLFPQENLSLTSTYYTKRSRPIGSSSTELDYIEHTSSISPRIPMKSYVVGEIRTHHEVQRLIEEIKLNLKAINAEFKQKSPRSRITAIDTPSSSVVRSSMDERFISMDETLTHMLDLLQTYDINDLPEKNVNGERIFFDPRLEDEIQRLRAAQRKYIQDIQLLKQKNKEQANYLDQLLTQLTKTNRKKADTGDYLTLLLRPTLDILQKTRSNIENHLKETNNPNQTPPGSAQYQQQQPHSRRHRTHRQD